MKLVIFGLTVSSSWGNGHATLWRALCRALARRGHEVFFFEKDVPYYAAHRDLTALPTGTLVLYPDWQQVLPRALEEVSRADVAMVTSYCPDGVAATDLVLSSKAGLRVFYDLDTPVTLNELRAGKALSYIGPARLSGFDLVLSYTGGQALEQLKTQLGARRVAPLYGSVDPQTHRPVTPVPGYAADLSYLGTYAADRQEAVERLFLQPARELPHHKFVIGGAQYPTDFPWVENVFFVRHLPPAEHPAFFSSSRLTLNVTRSAMAAMGYCPSGRLFEAAACGTPLVSDWWEGLDEFLEPGAQIIVAHSKEHVVAAMELPPEELARIGLAGRERVLTAHTADHRAEDLEALLQDPDHPATRPAVIPTQQRNVRMCSAHLNLETL